jgi:hypothetical protein
MFSKKSLKPYKDEGLNKIYDLLFCDNIDLYKSETKSPVYPWDVLLASAPANDKLKAITDDQTLEARHKILAYNLLLKQGAPANQKKLLGVIVEVALSEGLDLLAAFNDGTARYINHSGKLLVWETQTEESKDLIDKLFSDSMKVIDQIGPWNKARKPCPSKGMVRLTFLVSDGLYYGEGPFEVLERDPMGGPVIQSAAGLMSYLIQVNIPDKDQFTL